MRPTGLLYLKPLKNWVYRTPIDSEQDLRQIILLAVYEMIITSSSRKPKTEFENVFVIGDSICNQMCNINEIEFIIWYT